MKITVSGSICFAYGITDGSADAGIAIEFGRRNEQSSRCSLYGVAHPAGKGIFRFRSGNLQTGNGESILGINPNGEADRFSITSPNVTATGFALYKSTFLSPLRTV